MTPPKGTNVRREATSIKVNPELWKKAKIAAIQKDMELSQVVEEALEEWIQEQAEKKPDKKE